MVSCQAESPASMEVSPLWKFEDQLETLPTKDAALAFSGQKLMQVEEPDTQVDLILDSNGPALVGELFVVPVTILSKGHSVHSNLWHQQGLSTHVINHGKVLLSLTFSLAR